MSVFKKDPKNTISTEEEDRLNDQIDQLETEIHSFYTDIGEEYYKTNRDNPQGETMASCFEEIGKREEEIQNCKDQIRVLKGITTCEHCGADIMVTDTFCPACGERIISEITVSSSGGTCPNCGSRVEPDQMFCSTCGAKVTISETISDEDILLEETRIYEVPEEEESGFETEEPEPKTEEPEPKTEEPEPETAEEEEFGFKAKEPEPEMEEPEITEPEPDVAEPAMEESDWEEISVEEKQVCPYCGEEIEADMKFCVFCGKPIGSDEFSEGGILEPEEEMRPAFCPNCGAKLEPDDLFCTNCGQKVTD